MILEAMAENRYEYCIRSTVKNSFMTREMADLHWLTFHQLENAF